MSHNRACRITVKIERLHPRASRIAEHEELPAHWILLQPATNQSVEPVKSLAKIGRSNGQIHPPGSCAQAQHRAASLTMSANTRTSRSSNSLDFQPRSPFKSKPITTPLSNGPGLNLHKARFPRLPLLSQPTLQIKQAHSLSTAELHSRQSALLIQRDNSCLLLRAKAPTRPSWSCHSRFPFAGLSQIPPAIA